MFVSTTIRHVHLTGSSRQNYNIKFRVLLLLFNVTYWTVRTLTNVVQLYIVVDYFQPPPLLSLLSILLAMTVQNNCFNKNVTLTLVFAKVEG